MVTVQCTVAGQAVAGKLDKLRRCKVGVGSASSKWGNWFSTLQTFMVIVQCTL
jgi:hypothetical protein